MKQKMHFTNITPISIIGSGNLASQLIEVFIQNNYSLKQVISRSNKKELTQKYKGKFEVQDQIELLNRDATIYIIMVNDDSISEVINKWPFELNGKQIVIHTSGSASSTLLQSISENYGVLWPIQSILKNSPNDWSNTPFCITANNKYSTNAIEAIIKPISKNIKIVSDMEREKLHLIAVVLNNFTNYLFHRSQVFLEKNNLAFDLFLPIIEKTVNRLKDNNPKDLQTGPAKRKDTQTIQKHLNLLSEDEKLKTIYQLMSELISQK